MIDRGMDNQKKVLYRLIEKANRRIKEIETGEKPALTPDSNAKYFAEFEVDLNIIGEPMIADPDVNNNDISKRYTHDTIRPLSYYKGEFEWAQDQLDILKGSTSELISNDAIDLSVFILEHYALDTSAKPMQLFAKADLLTFQNI